MNYSYFAAAVYQGDQGLCAGPWNAYSVLMIRMIRFSSLLVVLAVMTLAHGCDGFAQKGKGIDGKGSRTMEVSTAQREPQRVVPEIDRTRPKGVETATFALG
jgi:hypothetical protein